MAILHILTDITTFSSMENFILHKHSTNADKCMINEYILLKMIEFHLPI